LIVCATIVRENEALLVRHSSRQKRDHVHWLLPAGKVEAGESLQQALMREVEEELNLEVKVARKLGEHLDPYAGDKLTNFLCVPLGSEIRTSSELAEAKWFNLEEVKRMRGIHPGLRQFLVDGLKSGSLQG